ncbi:hypothetical protein ENSA5_47890 [Enhygromyxa salina]|uniref:Uncharacterized protein n=1 Tax=Enhygromyxa salina TaxID=215803 RepID=A0A2S9XI97_9BACT|nr:hypothetical protein ENSA5_47890 [Enhygromyxa salina]
MSGLRFTDLRESTAIHDRVGDSAAFVLVSEYSETMTRIITRWRSDEPEREPELQTRERESRGPAAAVSLQLGCVTIGRS